MPFVPGSSLWARRSPGLAAALATGGADRRAGSRSCSRRRTPPQIVHRDLKPRQHPADRAVAAGPRGRDGLRHRPDPRYQRLGRPARERSRTAYPTWPPSDWMAAYVAPSPADMWALGVTLYTAVEGRPPFTGSTTAEVMTALRTRPVPLLEQTGPLRDLIGALLAKDPGQPPWRAGGHDRPRRARRHKRDRDRIRRPGSRHLARHLGRHVGAVCTAEPIFQGPGGKLAAAARFNFGWHSCAGAAPQYPRGRRRGGGRCCRWSS